ncbi:MAG: hypothetical protein AAF492_15210, partial [Verrucomicrobiota bacterium]
MGQLDRIIESNWPSRIRGLPGLSSNEHAAGVRRDPRLAFCVQGALTYEYGLNEARFTETIQQGEAVFLPPFAHARQIEARNTRLLVTGLGNTRLELFVESGLFEEGRKPAVALNVDAGWPPVMRL